MTMWIGLKNPTSSWYRALWNADDTIDVIKYNLNEQHWNQENF